MSTLVAPTGRLSDISSHRLTVHYDLGRTAGSRDSRLEVPKGNADMTNDANKHEPAQSAWSTATKSPWFPVAAAIVLLALVYLLTHLHVPCGYNNIYICNTVTGESVRVY